MRYKIVRVKWLDASRTASDWTDGDEVQDLVEKDIHETCSVESVGMLISKTRKALVLASHYTGEDFLHVMKIPQFAVTSIDYFGFVDTPALPPL